MKHFEVGDGEVDASAAAVNPFRPDLLAWMPVTIRGWLIRPMIFIALATGVIAITTHDGSTGGLGASGAGWVVAMSAVIFGSIVVALFGCRAYVTVTEGSAADYRKSYWTVTCAVVVITLVSGAATRNIFLASASVYLVLPMLALARNSILRQGRSNLRRPRLVVAIFLAVSLAACLIPVVVVVTAHPDHAHQQTYATLSIFYLGAVAIIGAVVTLIQLKPARHSIEGD